MMKLVNPRRLMAFVVSIHTGTSANDYGWLGQPSNLIREFSSPQGNVQLSPSFGGVTILAKCATMDPT